MIDVIYGALVNRVPGIRERYQKARNHSSGIGRMKAWIYLFYMNIAYYIFSQKKYGFIEKYPYYEEKQLYSKGSESSISCRYTPKEYAEKLAKADVISFDVFDTLVFRPFSSPADLFFWIGDKLDYMDFKRIREEMEWKVRQKKYKSEKHYEISLDEIYEVLSDETGLDKNSTMQMELDLEYELCFANPFMKEVVEELRKLGKRIIICSDMYLNTEQIKELLKKCGYSKFDAYYVSSDLKKSKSKGDLFEFVKSSEGKEKSFAHTGDNYIADVQNSEKHGFKPFHYVNVNAAGEPYRAYDMSTITGSIYRGLVNSHIHNGLERYTSEYEYGYIYGGIFVTGYCKFIHEYAEKNEIDKILFLARDGDILMKAYQRLYPESSIKTEYVYWSRLAATKLAAKYYKYDYFRRFLHHKVNQKYSIKQILKTMELEDMLGELCRECSLTEETFLTEKNIDLVKKYLNQHWEEVLAHYSEQLEAGKQYYGEVLKACKNAVAVDIGWAGSGAITLNHIVNEIWNLDCEITGIIAGTNTCHNAEPDATETFLQSGKLVSYLYSQRENRDIWKYHDPGKDHNLYWEILLDAPMGSFKGFYFDENGKCECQFKEAQVDVKRIEEVQKGILDFVDQYQGIVSKASLADKISGRDAYAPMVNVMSSINRDFVKKISGLMDEMNV